MKPVIIIAVLVFGVGLSTVLFNKNVITKQDAIDSFSIGLQPIKAILSPNGIVSFKGDAYHSEFYPMSRFYLLPIHVELYNDSNNSDTLLTIEVQQPDSAINSILKNRKIIYSGNANGFTYKLSTL
jgi:hypothetical protein